MSLDTENLFNAVVKGRYPLSDTISSARSWIPRPDSKINLTDDQGEPEAIEGMYVPRPDLNYGTLWWLSWFGFLGLDHFYLRNPSTGIAKLLTLGGFGFWWLWDLAQLSFEKERVLNYGLSTPFDFSVGIGQGMINDVKGRNNYSQTTNFGIWYVATLFGFLGFDSMMLGRTWLGIRKLLVLSLVLITVLPMILVRNNWTFMGFVFILVFIQVILAWLAAWGSDAYTLLFNADSIMTDGLAVPAMAYQGFGYIRGLYEDKEGRIRDDLKLDWQKLEEHYMFPREGITAQELRDRFWIKRSGEYVTFDEASETPPGVPPLTVIARMFGVMGEWIVLGLRVCWGILFPPSGVQAVAARIAVDRLERGGSEAEAVAASGAAAAMRAVAPQQGGARESLSLESQIMGAVVVALIAGGSLKGLVDYLFTE
jgi:hypothetical protein